MNMNEAEMKEYYAKKYAYIMIGKERYACGFAATEKEVLEIAQKRLTKLFGSFSDKIYTVERKDCHYAIRCKEHKKCHLWEDDVDFCNNCDKFGFMMEVQDEVNNVGIYYYVRPLENFL